MDADNNSSGSLRRGADTFILDRLDTILKSERFSYDHRNANPPSFSEISYAPLSVGEKVDTHCSEFENLDEVIRCFSIQDTERRATDFCKELCGNATPASTPVSGLDALFSKSFAFRVQPLENSQATIKRASDILKRLPVWPLGLDDALTECPSDCRASSTSGTALRDARIWEQSLATRHVSSDVLRITLSGVMDEGCAHNLRHVTDIIAALLELISQLVLTVSDIRVS